MRWKGGVGETGPCPGAGPGGRKVLFVGSSSTGIEGKAGQINAWGRQINTCPPGRIGDGEVGR